MHAVLWRAVPYPDADRILVVDAEVREAALAGLSAGETLDLQAEPDLFDDLAYVIGVDAPRFLMLVLAGFGIAAIRLVAVGLYGTLAYLTSLRTQEFGVCMVLGASAWQVLRAVAGEAIVLAANWRSAGICRGLCHNRCAAGHVVPT